MKNNVLALFEKKSLNGNDALAVVGWAKYWQSQIANIERKLECDDYRNIRLCVQAQDQLKYVIKDMEDALSFVLLDHTCSACTSAFGMTKTHIRTAHECYTQLLYNGVCSKI